MKLNEKKWIELNRNVRKWKEMEEIDWNRRVWRIWVKMKRNPKTYAEMNGNRREWMRGKNRKWIEMIGNKRKCKWREMEWNKAKCMELIGNGGKRMEM